MTDKKISDLAAGTPAQSSDLFPIDRAGANFKLALSDLSTVVGSGDTLNTVAASGASQAVNYTTADVWDITLTANCTITLSGFVNAKPDYLTLVLRQDATGSRTVTWPAITWIGTGIAPVLQTAAGAVDSVVLFSFDGGVTVFGIAQTSASGLKAGTSFPGSPSDGDLFYRTDRRIIYEYNASITRWLSLDRKHVTFTAGSVLPANSGSSGSPIGYLPLFEDVYVESWVMTTQIVTTNNGTSFWTFQLYKDAAGTATLVASQDTHSDAANVWVSHVVAIGALFAAASFVMFEVDQVKTSTPGNAYSSHMLVVRSAG